MKPVAITGIGALSPHGEGAGKMIAAMMEGKTGTRIDYPVPKTTLKPANKRLRLDRISKMALYGAWAALDQSGYEYEEKRGTIGISLGTATGGLGQSMELISKLLDNRLDFAAPMIFPNTVKNACANQIAIALSIYGTNITFAGGAGASIAGIKEGMILIGAGKEKAMLAGGVEEIVAKEVTAQHEASIGSGEHMGEGAYILCLEPSGGAAQRGADILAELSVVETEHEKVASASLMKALYKTALRKTGLSHNDIDLVIFHGVESHEALLAISPPARQLSSGEVLGLSGAIGAGSVVMGVYALRYGIDGFKPKNVAIAQNSSGCQSVVILRPAGN